MNVLTIGGAMVDTIVVIADDQIERMSMLNADSSFLLLEEGHKTEAVEISTHCGGGAVNAAVASARLGHKTATIIKLGTDGKATTIKDRLSLEGIDLRWLATDDQEPTGSSVIISSHDRNAAVFTYRGSNTRLLEADVAREAFEGIGLVYVANLSNRSAERYPLIIERASASGAKIAVNPGIRQLTARSNDFWNSLGRIGILTVNRVEAEALLPRLLPEFGEGGPLLPVKSGETGPALAKRGLRHGGYEMSLVRFFASLAQLGLGTAVLTDGSHGAYVSNGKEIFYRDAAHVTAAATIGAGDAFSTTLSCCLAASGDIPRALSAATLNAASVVAYVDTQSGLLTSAALEAALQREPSGAVQRYEICA